ncbi:MAG TPA: 6,7-dimethyl-8-ribityllumazine synthase [Saprospiraceae bacterium]|nr:6,7-dimethyl-8-ribityllumazine synthase [Saprospiraceae bacterium]
MEDKKKNLSAYTKTTLEDVSEMRIGIVAAEWNAEVVDALLEGALQTLASEGISDANVHVIRVPGTFELPSGADLLLRTTKIDGVICLGCVVKGDTRHDEYINSAVSHGLTNLSISAHKPVIFGVLTTENMQQAVDRAGGQHGNKGVEAAITVLKMVQLFKNQLKPKHSIGFGGNAN